MVSATLYPSAIAPASFALSQQVDYFNRVGVAALRTWDDAGLCADFAFGAIDGWRRRSVV
jgi:hypothetical protein